MTLRDNRLTSMRQLQQEIETLEKDMKKRKKLHEELSQELLNLVMKSEVGKDPIDIIHKSEKIQQQISENLTDIRHLDKKISKMKHRANRMNQIN
jgi:Txe/YoeB family toxin of Txe-Axe toxin-antitoxin module